MENGQNKNIFIVIIVIVIVIGVGFFATKGLKNSKKTAEKNIEAIPTSEPEEPTPTPEYKRENYAIKILNGSGKAGAAAVLEEMLKGEKFNITGTDNADNYDYETTEIRTKVGIDSQVVEDLKTVMKDDYKVTIGAELPATAEADVEVIIGAE